jgi:hypothetical protein
MVPDKVRRAFGDSQVTLERLERKFGPDEVDQLRRSYFPRWRRSRAYAAGESVRGVKGIVVDDEFEGEVVKALAPRELSVRIRIRERV